MTAGILLAVLVKLQACVTDSVIATAQESHKAVASKLYTCSWLLRLRLLGLLLQQPAAGEQGTEDVGHRVGDCLLLGRGRLLRCNGGSNLCRRRGG